MRVCFLLETLERSGGVSVVEGHARGLEAHGIDAEIVLTDPRSEARSAGVPVRRLEQLDSDSYDIAVATWWATARSLYRVHARRRAVFLQSVEHRFYPPDEVFERLAAEAVLQLPVDYVAISPWIRELLAEVRPDARCSVVPNGIDKQLFAGRERHVSGGPLRVLVDGQPNLWFKGVHNAVAAVRGMTEPAELTLVALDPSAAGEVDADRVLGGLSPAEMGNLYEQTDVVLKLSRVEGLGLVPLEAFHVGVPCVVTPYTGHEDYVRHGQNGLVAGFDDQPGTSAWLDRLASDRELLASLSRGALDTAAAWPDSARSTALMAAALGEIAAGEQPEDADAAAGLLDLLELGRLVGEPRMGSLMESELALEQARAHVQELSDSRDECSDMLDEARRQLEEVKDSRAYRTALAMRQAIDRVRR